MHYQYMIIYLFRLLLWLIWTFEFSSIEGDKLILTKKSPKQPKEIFYIWTSMSIHFFSNRWFILKDPLNKNGDRINLQSYLMFRDQLQQIVQTFMMNGLWEKWDFSLMIYDTNPSSISELEMPNFCTIFRLRDNYFLAIFRIKAHFENLQRTWKLSWNPSENVTLKMTIKILLIPGSIIFWRDTC